MTVSIVPALIDTLVTAADATVPANVNVFDGFGVSDDPGDYLMIGVDDPDADGWANTADAQEDISSVGPPSGARDQTGSVVCVALSWNGDCDQKAARDAALTTMTALAAYVRANPGLSIASGSQTFWCWFSPSEAWKQQQDDAGAKAQVVFRIGFFARL